MKSRIVAAVFTLLLFCALTLFAAYNIHMCLSGQSGLCSIAPATVLAGLAIPQVRGFALLGVATSALIVLWMLFGNSYIKYRNGMREVVPGLWTPEPAGQGQHGTARWMEPKNFGKHFTVVTVDTQSQLVLELISCSQKEVQNGR